MNTFTYECPICGQSLEVLRIAVGLTGSCPGCGTTGIIPSPPDKPPAPLPPPRRLKARATYPYARGNDGAWLNFWVVIVLAFNALGLVVDGGPGFWMFRGFWLLMALVVPLVITRQYVCIDRIARTVTWEFRMFDFFLFSRQTYHFSEFKEVYIEGLPLLIKVMKEANEHDGGDFTFLGFRQVGGGMKQVTYVEMGRDDSFAEVQRIAQELAAMTGLPVVEMVGFPGTSYTWPREELKEALQAIRTQLLDVLDQLASADHPSVSSSPMERPLTAAYRFLEEKLVEAVAQPLAARRDAVSKLLSDIESLIVGV